MNLYDQQLADVVEEERLRRARRHPSTERLFRELISGRPHRYVGVCVYCGAPAAGRVCAAHSDLQGE